MKNWIINLKARLMRKWANEFDLTVVKIKKVGNTEYLLCHDGHIRKLAKVTRGQMK